MRPGQLARAVRRMGPYLLAHHPLCGPFRADVMQLGGKRFCIACFVGYPAIAATLVALAFLAPREVPPGGWIAGGVLLVAPQGLSFAGRVPSPRAQVAIKIALGAGIGSVMFGLWSLPFSWWVRLPLIVGALAAVQSLWVLRLHRIERTCRACPQFPMRPRCEGLAELDDRVGGILAR